MAINTLAVTLQTFIGNESIKNQINDNITISNMKQSAFPHTLITSASGMGKTTLALAIAKEMNTSISEFNCASGNNLLPVIMKAPNNSIILLDEVHALPLSIMESTLYRFMDEGMIHIRYPDGQIEPFKVKQNVSFIAATTELDKLPQTLINRFTIHLKLKPYTLDEMIQILKLNLSNLTITPPAYKILSNATRYVPRVAVQFSTLVKNYAFQHNLTSLDTPQMIQALSTWGIDENGLTLDDYEYMKLIYETFNNAPTGLNALKSMLNSSDQSIITLENHLIREGLLKRTSRGRMLTGKGLSITMN